GDGVVGSKGDEMREALPEDREEIRVALLGSGAVAQVVHLPVLSRLPGVRLAAISDVDRPKAATIASRFGVPRVLRNDEEAFASDEIDAIVICTPSHLHEEQAIAALEAGKHVMVERPLALDEAGTERVLAAAEASGKALMVALNNRYRQDIGALLPFLRGG